MKNNQKHTLYTLSGQVIHGKGIGKTVGMPTANLQIEQEQLPPMGVYASIVNIRGVNYLGATNVGYCSYDDNKPQILVETFIIDFHGDLYGDFLKVDLYYFLRPTQKMKSLQDVSCQVMKDCKKVIELLGDFQNSTDMLNK